MQSLVCIEHMYICSLLSNGTRWYYIDGSRWIPSEGIAQEVAAGGKSHRPGNGAKCAGVANVPTVVNDSTP